MPIPAPPQVDCERLHPGLPVADVPAAVEFYTTRLGFTPGFAWGGEPPTFAGVNLGEVQVFLFQGTPTPEGGNVYFVVGDADELYAFHRDAGVEVLQEIGDREYGLRDYTVRGPDGHRLSFGHYVHSVGEPVPIERVDVPVRLEKRLAALLHDLAAHKRMTVSGLLEEILLHTNEPLGDIQQLKQKHGIDYDSHASYRWVER
jgi:catechol 2,3-dioxygenase-like lactoylglutathione lyase family enzyme